MLYLIRHGEAQSAQQKDAQRPLSDRGRREAEQTARWVADRGAAVSQIRHSGRLRARQTAEILARYWTPAGGVIAVPGLEPEDDVETAAAIHSNDGAVALVGHLPFLGRLAGLLLFRDPDRSPVTFGTGTLAVLECADGCWRVVDRFTPN